LSGLGAIKQSIEIFNSIDTKAEPEALFYKACALIYDWNYEETIPLFKEYIQFGNISPYRKQVGKINLAAAYVHLGDWASATALLDEIQIECESKAYSLLLGNCFELKAQVELYQGRYDQAQDFLSKAAELLKEKGGFYMMLVNKWIVICNSLRSKSSEDTKGLIEIRRQALEMGHWNTLRECDLFEGIVNSDQMLVKKVVMGTPSDLYRQRARKLFGKNHISKGKFLWFLGPPAASPDESNCFDPYKKAAGLEALYSKPMLLKLYEALTRDFYQPHSIGNLFQQIYPGEKFNAFTSPSRVLQLLRRLNQWFRENELPIRVQFKKSEFTLTSKSSILLVINRGTQLSSAEGKLFELKSKFSDHGFSVSNASEVLGLSKASAERLLKQAFEQGKVLKDGSRRGLTYRLASYKSKKRAI
jgi:tetratricopeptide (TPR) repeat protein